MAEGTGKSGLFSIKESVKLDRLIGCLLKKLLRFFFGVSSNFF